jgi:hypothetical protein
LSRQWKTHVGVLLPYRKDEGQVWYPLGIPPHHQTVTVSKVFKDQRAGKEKETKTGLVVHAYSSCYLGS